MLLGVPKASLLGFLCCMWGSHACVPASPPVPSYDWKAQPLPCPGSLLHHVDLTLSRAHCGPITHSEVLPPLRPLSQGLEASQALCHSQSSVSWKAHLSTVQITWKVAWLLFPVQTIALPNTLPTCVHVETSSSFPGHSQTQRLLVSSVVKQSRTILEVLLNFRSCCDEGTKKLSLNHGGRHRKAGRKRSQMKGRSCGDQVWHGTD